MSTPEVAHAALWSPSVSRRPGQAVRLAMAVETVAAQSRGRVVMEQTVKASAACGRSRCGIRLRSK